MRMFGGWFGYCIPSLRSVLCRSAQDVKRKLRFTSAATSRMLRNRLQRRLLHHILIGAGSVGLIILFMHLFSKRDLISQVSIATAYSALFLTAATLLLGPFKVLRRKPNPISTDLRRDLGIWAGISALLHTAVGLNVHLRGKMWLYFVDTHHHPRRDAFCFWKYHGVLAGLGFGVLFGSF